jgi:hypothetical protein
MQDSNSAGSFQTLLSYPAWFQEELSERLDVFHGVPHFPLSGASGIRSCRNKISHL